jgi:membrane protease YdiL (CAAX protease family)
MSIKKSKAGIRKSKGKKQALAIVLLLFSLLFSFSSNAQCAMCRAALEGEGNSTKAAAVNDGIVYLMAIPYILVVVIGYFVYKTGKKLVKK